jgi:hypothetical protein
MNQDEMLKNHVQSIGAVLRAEAANLEPLIAGVLAKEPVLIGGQTSAAFMSDICKVSMPVEDAKAILAALKAAEKKHGYNRKFQGFQINFLVNEWRRICVALESPPKQ